MGVMQCDRLGCQNICCRRYSIHYGYICNDCFEELVDSGTGSIGNFMRRPRPREEEKMPREFYERFFKTGQAT